MKSVDYLFIPLLICVIVPGLTSVVQAENSIPLTQGWNPYQGWDLDLVSNINAGVFPGVEVTWTPDSSDSSEASMPKTSLSSTDYWVKLAYYPHGSNQGQPAILSGYVGGKNYNSKVTISGKKLPGDEFHDIITITPQDNGIFAWAVPDSLNSIVYYQATATSTEGSAKSEIVKTSDVNAYTPASPSQSPSVSPTKTSDKIVAAAVPVITTLTLSSDTLTPTVGAEVELSGRLTGSNGKGIDGQKITIEAPDWGTDFLPLTTAITESDGGYSASIKTHEDGIVQVRAVFEGTDDYMGSTSNSLTFNTMSK